MDAEVRRQFAGARVPRYTSYPTAPHFSDAIGEAAYRQWLAAVDPAAPLSLYLHVPFCRSLCRYCGCFTKITGRSEPIAHYLAALGAEIDLVADALPGRMHLTHVHWGGGTPTIIGADLFGHMMEVLRRRFAIEPGAEHAIEIDPRRLDAETVRALAAAGVNRASLGVQTFDETVQSAVGRRQSFEETRAAAEALRASGIEHLNIDLIYGLPHQTEPACRETIVRVLELAPDRVAAFGYAHVPAMKPHQATIDEAALPGAAEREAQADIIATMLVEAGYVAIGLDHFARPGDALARRFAERRLRRNFQGYTADEADTLIGLGASAIGSLPQAYVQNAAVLPLYEDAVLAGRLPVARGVALSAEDRAQRDIIGDLMCYLRADLGAIAARHRLDPGHLAEARAHLSAALAHGLAHFEGDCLIVPEAHRALVRAVAAAFDTYLGNGAGRHSVAV